MYTEMLSDGMVKDEEKQKRYVSTLRTESNRLSHLVENVLAYAQLERGRPGRRKEDVSLEEILGRVRERLAEHAERSGFSLEIEENGQTNSPHVKVDTSAVEQILFNLVDNACKYAASGEDKRIVLKQGLENCSAEISVRDFGPGISRDESKQLFQPFTKSAHEAAKTAPGVGLELSLSQRLARGMGGDLKLDEFVNDGACFILTLPQNGS